MINWMYFPKNRKIDSTSYKVVKAFEDVKDEIDSDVNELKSDDVLEKVRPNLEKCDFTVEKSKKSEDKISVPVLYGLNGKIEKYFDADAYLDDARYVVEVEAGRGVTNYQFLKDFFEACTMAEVDYLCIAVRNTYKNSRDFEKVCLFFESMYAGGRIGIPLKGLLILGY